MVSGRWITRRAEAARRILLALAATAGLVAPAGAQVQPCAKPVYLTLDTGHMEVAPLMAAVLARQEVKVTFFAANERTQTGDGSLGAHWSGWWRERAAEGHEFASHTWDHVYWRADMPGTPPRFRVRASAGPAAGRDVVWTAAQYCEQIDKAAHRLQEITGKQPLPLFRAPGGKTSPRFLRAAKGCGYAHVGWSPAGFLGDELPSEAASNEALLHKALRDVRSGDILVAHLGIWSRKDAWAPAVFEPLIVGLKQKGFCFRTLREHPDYGDWIAKAR